MCRLPTHLMNHSNETQQARRIMDNPCQIMGLLISRRPGLNSQRAIEQDAGSRLKNGKSNDSIPSVEMSQSTIIDAIV